MEEVFLTDDSNFEYFNDPKRFETVPTYLC